MCETFRGLESRGLDIGSCERGRGQRGLQIFRLRNKVDHRAIKWINKKRRDLLEERMGLDFNMLNFRY